MQQQIAELKEVMTENAAFLKGKFAEQSAEEIRAEDIEHLKEELVSNQASLEHLVALTETNLKDVAVCESF